MILFDTVTNNNIYLSYKQYIFINNVRLFLSTVNYFDLLITNTIIITISPYNILINCSNQY